MARQNFLGLVISQGKMNKTVKVRVEHKVFNKKINKELLKRKDYLVHDEGEISREGDYVRIESTRPLSKHKSFAIAEIKRNKGQQFAKYDELSRSQVAKEEAVKTREFLTRRAQYQHELETKTSLVDELALLQKANSGEISAEEQTRLQDIKTKYNIADGSELQSRLASLDIQSLRHEVQELTARIDTLPQMLEDLVNDTARANEILKSMGKDPETLKPAVKKNLLRKHILTSEL